MFSLWEVLLLFFHDFCSCTNEEQKLLPLRKQVGFVQSYTTEILADEAVLWAGDCVSV